MIGQTISHYKIIDKLGEGGMGVVYKAQDTTLDRFVAIKFLPTHLSMMGENKSRFLQEAKAAAALNHPNILNVYEIDEKNGTMFLVMEYLEGKTLKDHMLTLNTGSGLPYRQALEWLAMIGKGLKAAHDKNIIHRDIKPQNIMLSNGNTIKIMDFGLAKLKSGAGLTKTGTSLGTLSYMSPEQVQGIATDHRSDIWSLGVVFYEMLTGDLPFKAEHDAGLLYLISNEDPPDPSEMDKKIPRQLDQLMKKFIEKNRDHRFSTMDEALKEIDQIQATIETAGNQPKAKAIAVLPFGNISPDKESDYFSDGLTEELIINLSRLKDIRVVPRTTSMQYKGSNKEVKAIGRELGTRYILAGNVRKFQDNLRIAVELVDVEADAQLWAETYKGKLEDVFDIQENVSKQIVDALMVKLTPKEQVVLTKRATLNAQAFDCNLRARDSLYRFTKTGVQIAIELFEKAIEYDARYADAYAGLSEAYAHLYQQFERNETWLDRALESGLKALMYDPSLSEAYSALGLVYLYKKSHEEALESSKKAVELNPTNHTAYWILGRTYVTTDRIREAAELFQKVIELNPDFYTAHGDIILCYDRLGEKEKVKKGLDDALQMFPRYLSLHPDDARAYIFFALALVRAGRIEEGKIKAARAIELSPNDPLMFYNVACFYANVGDTLLALQSLKKALSTGYGFYEWIKRDPDLDSIRNEPEYIELMKGK
jgi:serine/threonine protein kinase/Tfp pilus assembly protein PilF